MDKLHNCWTCACNYYDEDGRSRCEGLHESLERITAWLADIDTDLSDMPPRDADGCPGWRDEDDED